MLKPGGILLVGTPVGRERLCFDANRVFDPQTIVDAFKGLRLSRFAVIGETAGGAVDDAEFRRARECSQGCGLFVFEKPDVGRGV